MPLSKVHKAETRARIVAAAGKLFRRQGFDGVGGAHVGAEHRQGDEVLHVQGKGRRETAEDEQRRSEYHHEQCQADHQPDVDLADKADAFKAHQARDSVHRGNQDNGQRLGDDSVGQPPHGVHGAADLQAKETDRTDGAGHYRDDRGSVGQGADRALERSLAEQGVKQGARRQRKAFIVMQVHQHDRQQEVRGRAGGSDEGIGKTGGIGRLPIVIPTVQIMLNKNKFPAGFGEKSRQFWLAQFDRALNIVKTAEKGIPAATWEDFPAESIPKYAVMYREARLEIAKQGIYNKTTLNVMKKARCSVNPSDAECATQREID